VTQQETPAFCHGGTSSSRLGSPAGDMIIILLVVVVVVVIHFAYLIAYLL
jgi:hypothetical protein